MTIVLDDTDVAFLFDGERKTEKERGALVGKRILKRRVDGKTMSTLVGESATPEQEAALNSLDALDSDAYLYPDTSVPPGTGGASTPCISRGTSGSRAKRSRGTSR
ncbi:MAG: hypothetical protein IPN83_18845 [Holophagales bacterium]|nr:hypothetical protein [Holophagales bacterium]